MLFSAYVARNVARKKNCTRCSTEYTEDSNMEQERQTFLNVSEANRNVFKLFKIVWVQI